MLAKEVDLRNRLGRAKVDQKNGGEEWLKECGYLRGDEGLHGCELSFYPILFSVCSDLVDLSATLCRS